METGPTRKTISSGELIMEEKLSKFVRFLPKEGVCVYPEVWYYDVNDIPTDVRKKHKQFFHEDVEYKVLFDKIPHCYWMQLEPKFIGIRYCAYVYRKRVCVGSVFFTEHFDNPDGYNREGDFQLHKWIYPDFRRTIYSRYAFGDLVHILFVSRLADRLYSYQAAKPGEKTGELWKRVDMNNPCRGIRFLTDIPEVRPYIRHIKAINTKVGDYILTEFNGNVYRSMDLKKYFMTPPGRTEKVVDRWLIEMNIAAGKIVRESDA